MGVTRLLLLAVLAVCVLAGACRNDDDDSGGIVCIDECETAALNATPTSAPTIDTAQSATAEGDSCSSEPAATPGDSEGMLVSGGLERFYLLHVPPGYNGTAPMPLVINLHGFGSSAADQVLYSRFNALADEKGFIVVAPNGSGYPQRWNFPGLGTVDDVAFIGELIDELAATMCIDESRVYAAGMSNGAAISTFVACGLPGRVAAIGAVGATAGPRTCPDDVIVPVITFRGTDDACVPYEGGTSSCGMMLPVVGAEEVARLWGDHNSCDATPVMAQVSEHVRTTSYANCIGDADVMLYTIEGGGHTWPSSINVPRLGPVTDEIDATALIWAFFERYSTP